MNKLKRYTIEFQGFSQLQILPLFGGLSLFFEFYALFEIVSIIVI